MLINKCYVHQSVFCRAKFNWDLVPQQKFINHWKTEAKKFQKSEKNKIKLCNRKCVLGKKVKDTVLQQDQSERRKITITEYQVFEQRNYGFFFRWKRINYIICYDENSIGLVCRIGFHFHSHQSVLTTFHRFFCIEIHFLLMADEKKVFAYFSLSCVCVMVDGHIFT